MYISKYRKSVHVFFSIFVFSIICMILLTIPIKVQAVYNFEIKIYNQMDYTGKDYWCRDGKTINEPDNYWHNKTACLAEEGCHVFSYAHAIQWVTQEKKDNSLLKDLLSYCVAPSDDFGHGFKGCKKTPHKNASQAYNVCAKENGVVDIKSPGEISNQKIRNLINDGYALIVNIKWYKKGKVAGGHYVCAVDYAFAKSDGTIVENDDGKNVPSGCAMYIHIIDSNSESSTKSGRPFSGKVYNINIDGTKLVKSGALTGGKEYWIKTDKINVTTALKSKWTGHSSVETVDRSYYKTNKKTYLYSAPDTSSSKISIKAGIGVIIVGEKKVGKQTWYKSEDNFYIKSEDIDYKEKAPAIKGFSAVDNSITFKAKQKHLIGADLKDEPYSNAKNMDFAKYNAALTVSGLYINKNKEYWVGVKKDGRLFYVCADSIKRSDSDDDSDDVTINGNNYSPKYIVTDGKLFPNGKMKKGDSFDLKGTIKSSYEIKEAQAFVYGGTLILSKIEVKTKSEKIKKQSFDLNKSLINNAKKGGINFGTLSKGYKLFRLDIHYEKPVWHDISNAKERPLKNEKCIRSFYSLFTVGSGSNNPLGGIIKYSVTVTNDGNGTGKANPSSAEKGKTVKLTASPKKGYRFKQWKVISGGVSIKNNQFTMKESDVKVKAIFEKEPEPEPTVYTVTVTNDGNGTGSASPASGISGTAVTLTATPNAGYLFKEWSVISGSVAISNNQFTINNANVEIKAIFEKEPEPEPEPTVYTVKVTNDGNGAGSASPASGISGTVVTLTATPNAGYQFKEWQVVFGGVEVNIQANTFTIGSGNVEIKAVFEEIQESSAFNDPRFPDEKFRDCVKMFDTNDNGLLDNDELAKVTSLEVSSKGITSLEGLGLFTELQTLKCNDNALTTLDVSKNTLLTNLNCERNDLILLDVSNNLALIELNCWGNKLTTLNVNRCTMLEVLDCGCNELTSLDVSRNTALENLGCRWLSLSSLDVSKNIELKNLYCDDNQLTVLDVSKNINLLSLLCDRNQLTTLDVSKNTKLSSLSCWDCKLTSLDVSNNTYLRELDCDMNQITALDVRKNTALERLFCSSNQLSELDVSKNTALERLNCSSNQLSELDVSKNTMLYWFHCYDNKLTVLDVSASPKLVSLVRERPREKNDYGHDEFNGVIDWDHYNHQLIIDSTVKVIAGDFISEGTRSLTAIDISKAGVTSITDQTYTGKALTPAVTLKLNGKKLVKGKDYTVSFKNNKKIGKATVTILGTGKFTGKKTVTFRIVPEKVILSKLKTDKKTLTITWGRVGGIDGYEIEYSLKKNFKDAKKITIKKAKTTKYELERLKSKKTYYVRIRAYKKVNGKKYYSEWSKPMKKKVK